MKYKLKKDSIIKAGTVFDTELMPSKIEFGSGLALTDIELGKDIGGTFYCPVEGSGSEVEQLEQWFEVL